MMIALLDLGTWVFGVLAMSSLKAILLLLPCWIAVRLLRPIRPALEHGVWTAGLIGMPLLPLTGLTSLLPETAQSLVAAATVDLVALPTEAGGSTVMAAASTQGDWQGWAGLAYLLVLSALTGRLALGRRRASRLVSLASRITDDDAHETLNAVTAQCGLTKKVALLASAATKTPVTLGCFRPVIILPTSWREWPEGKLRGVLVHELSHVVRRDAWIASAAAMNCALFWFHPLSWWLKSRLTALAELACDDRSVLLTQDREGYAETLLSVASRSPQRNTQPAWPAPAMARTSRVTERIERILAITKPDTGLLCMPALRRLGVAMVVWLLVVGSVSFAPAQQGITLSGTVQDTSGARIPEALVFVSDAENEENHEVTRTRADGTFSLTGLQAGTRYNVKVRSPGFRAFQDAVTLSENQRFDIKLEMGSITETIVVSAKRLAPPTAPQESVRQRIRIGGNVQAAKLVHHVSPTYPPGARAEGVEGTVLMKAVIGKDGVPLNLTPRNSLVDQRLAQAAVEAVSQWRYEPSQLNGEPIEIATTVTVTFQLKD